MESGRGSGELLAGLAAELLRSPRLPEPAPFAELVVAARSALRARPPALRPRGRDGLPGGLLDLPDRPVILVPDLHARPEFLAALLAWQPPSQGGRSVAALLDSGAVSVLLLGDLLHGETGEAPLRWARAFGEYRSGWDSHAAMDEEMSRGLAVAQLVLAGLAFFPESFFCLKGNHDNLPAEEFRGDHGFRKFVDEGPMVASWFLRRYGEGLLRAYRGFELDLAVAARRGAGAGAFVASHGEPRFALAARDIADYRDRPEVVEALIWTANDEAEPDAVASSLESLLGSEHPGPRWFGGHRPVRRWHARSGGLYIQFHDPEATRVLLLEPGRAPDPERDLHELPPFGLHPPPSRG